MRDIQLASLLESATDSDISFDGLHVSVKQGTTMSVSTPERSRVQIDGSEPGTMPQDVAAYISNWYFWREVVGDPSSSRYAFLRWLDHVGDPLAQRYATMHGEGLTRTWGELRITVRITGDGIREYDLRHQHDRTTLDDHLERYDDPLDARSIAKFDGNGRYRPLKSAPTLQSGWYFDALSGHALVDTIDFLYPASIANWHLERQDALDVSHWVDTAERQTGIYERVGELDADAVARAATTCCVDAECLKRREWEYDQEESLGVAPGTGTFPCREPCSFLIAAARIWVEIEAEEPQQYTLDLTPTEKSQLENMVDAIAMGRTEEVPEAAFDDGANRHRARYFAAKYIDEDGRFRIE